MSMIFVYVLTKFTLQDGCYLQIKLCGQKTFMCMPKLLCKINWLFLCCKEYSKYLNLNFHEIFLFFENNKILGLGEIVLGMKTILVFMVVERLFWYFTKIT